MQVRANAAALGAALVKRGYKLVTGGTDNHLVLWDLRPEVGSSCCPAWLLGTPIQRGSSAGCHCLACRSSGQIAQRAHADSNSCASLPRHWRGRTWHQQQLYYGRAEVRKLLLLDVEAGGLLQGINGNKMEKACDLVHITLNKNAVVGDVSALAPGGVRIGAPAMTSRGLQEADFEKIADLLHEVRCAAAHRAVYSC